LTLSNRNGGDHTGSEAGHGQLGGEVVESVHAWLCRSQAKLRSLKGLALNLKRGRYPASGFFI
jgi:hypothetical protein